MTVQKLLLVLSVVAFVVLGLMGSDVVSPSHEGAWLGFGLALFAGAHL